MLLLGKPVADKILEEVEREVATLKKKPKLVVVSAKNFDSSSQVYMTNKTGTCTNRGMKAELSEIEWEGKTKEEFLNDLTELIYVLNDDKDTTGYLVQLPLPFGIGQKDFAHLIDPKKDIDGFHYENIGLMFEGEMEKALLPCTPHGIIKLLEHYEVELEGKDVVIINRSGIVGKPMLHMLLEKNATVQICHSRTKGLIGKCRRADIIITGVGRANFIDHSWVKDGATIVDVSINFDEETGKLCGDVAKKDYPYYENGMLDIDITPVPRGVGVMTVAMVAYNLLKAYKIQEGEM